MNKNIIITIVLLGVVLIAIFMFKPRTAVTPEVSTSSTTTQQGPSTATTADGITILSENTASATPLAVTISGIAMTPKTLSMKTGETATITFTNTNHRVNYTPNKFGAFGPRLPTDPNQTKPSDVIPAQKVTFTANKAGTYDYFCATRSPYQCSVGVRPLASVWGTLTVE